MSQPAKTCKTCKRWEHAGDAYDLSFSWGFCFKVESFGFPRSLETRSTDTCPHHSLDEEPTPEPKP